MGAICTPEAQHQLDDRHCETLVWGCIQKVIVRLASSLPAAVFEGPFPIVKIFTVLRTLWNVNEIAEAQEQYRGEIRMAVQQQLQEFARLSKLNAIDTAEKQLTALKEVNRQIAASQK